MERDDRFLDFSGPNKNTALDAYFRTVVPIKKLDKLEELELAHLMRQGGPESAKAREKFIYANLKLVISIAKRYTNNSNSLPLEDLIQYGNIGLIKAVDHFDPTKGYKFSTVATRPIKWAIQDGLHRSSRTIRLPSHAYDEITLISLTSIQFEKDHGREPSHKELSEITKLQQRRIEHLLSLARPMFSLDKVMGATDNTLAERLEDPNSDNIDLNAERSIKMKYLKQAIRYCLTERELEILTKHFGLNGEEPCNFNVMNEIYGVSPERIRQIEARAIRKLRFYFLRHNIDLIN